MRKRKSDDSFQIPLMYAFRDAFDAGDARKRIEERVGGERVLSGRGSLKRRGADEALLKRNLSLDLAALANTIDLASAVDLEGFDFVSRSVLNYGLRDVSELTSEEVGVSEVARDALLQHEPRLNAETLTVERDKDFDDVNQRIRLVVSAEMACKPLDVPIEFVAEIDVGSGKVQLSRLPATT
jgi:type VI secretion system protein ImpF